MIEHHEILYYEADKTLAQVAKRSFECLIPVSVKTRLHEGLSYLVYWEDSLTMAVVWNYVIFKSSSII